MAKSNSDGVLKSTPISNPCNSICNKEDVCNQGVAETYKSPKRRTPQRSARVVKKSLSNNSGGKKNHVTSPKSGMTRSTSGTKQTSPKITRVYANAAQIRDDKERSANSSSEKHPPSDVNSKSVVPSKKQKPKVPERTSTLRHSALRPQNSIYQNSSVCFERPVRPVVPKEKPPLPLRKPNLKKKIPNKPAGHYENLSSGIQAQIALNKSIEYRSKLEAFSATDSKRPIYGNVSDHIAELQEKKERSAQIKLKARKRRSTDLLEGTTPTGTPLYSKALAEKRDLQLSPAKSVFV